jgi:hypothetical protein
MPDIHFLEDLEADTAHGCMDPACTSTHHHDQRGLFLVPLCHPRAGVRVSMSPVLDSSPFDAILHVHCWKCRAEVSHMAMRAPGTAGPGCLHWRKDTQIGPADVQYSDGQLAVTCRRCHALKFMVVVPALASLPPEARAWAEVPIDEASDESDA